MDTVAPILGMSMLAFGFLLLLFCLGGLARTYWRRSGISQPGSKATGFPLSRE